MKKITAILFALVLVVCLLPVSAFAVGNLPQPDEYGYGYSSSLPQPDVWSDGSTDSGWSTGDNSGYNYTISNIVSTPVISSQPTDVSGSIGDVPAVLSVSAYTYDSGEVCYQWYAVNSSGLGGLTAIPGAYASTYTPPQSAGTAYYCVGVYNVAGSYRSTEVMSDTVAVSYSGIEIISSPTKVSYTQGETISLSGLVVRIYDANGGYWDSTNGSGLSVYPSKAETVGSVPVSLNYGMSSAMFYINVTAAASGTSTTTDGTTETADATDADHVHEYGDWVVTKEANCLNTGLRTRTCECGDTQTEVIPKTDHTWDEGVITKQPTETSNGSKLYTCTVCKANKSEIVPYGTDTSSSTLRIDEGEPDSTSNPSGTVNGSTVADGSTGTATNVGTVSKNSDSSGWWLIPVSALLLVGCGTGAYYLMKKKGGEQ